MQLLDPVMGYHSPVPPFLVELCVGVTPWQFLVYAICSVLWVSGLARQFARPPCLEHCKTYINVGASSALGPMHPRSLAHECAQAATVRGETPAYSVRGVGLPRLGLYSWQQQLVATCSWADPPQASWGARLVCISLRPVDVHSHTRAGHVCAVRRHPISFGAGGYPPVCVSL